VHDRARVDRATVSVPAEGRTDLTLFGEGPSRVIVSVDPVRALEVEALGRSAIPWRWIERGRGGERLRIGRGATTSSTPISAGSQHAWRRGFERHVA